MDYFTEKTDKDDFVIDGTSIIEDLEIPESGSIGSTVKIYDNKIYFGACDKHIYCLTLDGDLVWKFRAGDVVVAPPEIKDGVIFIGSFDGHMYALDAKTGELIWRFRVGGKIISGAAVVDNYVYFGSFDKHLYKLTTDGDLKWRFRTGSLIWNVPAIVNDKVFFGSHDRYFYCLSDDGKVLWKFGTGKHVDSSPTVTDNNGKSLWSRYGERNSSGEIDRGAVYFGSWDSMYKLSINGKLIWNMYTGNIVGSCPIVHDNELLFGSWDNRVHSIDTETGKKIWSFLTGGPVDSTPILNDNHFYFGSFDGHLYKITRKGELAWKFLTGGIIETSPTFLKDRMFFGSWDTYMYALSKDGKLLWKFQTGLPFQSPISQTIADVSEKSKKIVTFWQPETMPKPKHYIINVAEEKEEEDHAYKTTNTYDSPSAYDQKKKDKKPPWMP